jgi:integrase
MATGRITIGSLNGLEGWLWDDKICGLGARRQRKSIFFYLRYRHRARQVMHSIGRFGSPWTIEAARTEALRLLGILATGVDPCAQVSLLSETFGTEVERYLERKKASLKPRSFVETTRYLRDYATAFHKLTLAEIDRRSVAVLLGQVETNSGAITRNRLRAALSTFFTWAITEGLTEINPVQGTAKADEGNSRERVLSPDEIKALCAALGDDRFSDIVRLLLLTGQRRDEIGKLQWSEIDFAKNQINLPASRVKNSREHSVPLSTQALAILERVPQRNSSDFLFGERGFNNWDRCKQELDKRLQIAPWRIHDLRRTCATNLGELGVLPHVIETTLNHISGAKAGVAGVYNRSKMTDAVREALQKWAEHLEALVVGPRKQPVHTGLMERAFAVARGGKIVPDEDLDNLARQLSPLKRA